MANLIMTVYPARNNAPLLCPVHHAVPRTILVQGGAGLCRPPIDNSRRNPFFQEGKNLDNIQLTMLIRIEPNTAPQKPLT
jgi:hypothetical protein